MRQLYFRRTSSSNVGWFEDANDERCHLWTLLHNGDEFFGFATAIHEKLYECVVHLESDKRVSRTMHFKTHFFSPAILSPSFASQKIQQMNPSNVSWIPILSNYFSRYLPRCNISNASYNLHHGNGCETSRCVGMIESSVFERSFFVQRIAASFLLQVIGISRTKDICIWLLVTRWSLEWRLGLTFERSSRQTLPRLGLPPIHLPAPEYRLLHGVWSKRWNFKRKPAHSAWLIVRAC